MADLDKLVLQIESDSVSAVSGIDALATSLGKLKSATSGGLGLSSIAKNLSTIKTSLSGFNNVSGLEKAVNALKGLNGVKVSSSIANQIQNIGTALSTLNIGDGATKISELVSALKPLETLGKSSLSSTVSALNKLPEAISKIDMKKLHGQVDALTRTFKPLAEEMQKIANGFNAFPSRIQKLIKENEKLSSSNDKTSTSYINLWAKMKMAYNAIKTGARLIGNAISKSMDYTENVNLFNVAMGEYAEEARAYAEEVGEVMGIDPGEWMRNQGTLMTLATGFGVASDRANTMSKNLTQLSYDLSSLFNMPFEETMQKVQSGLAGELEPLRRIGFDLSVARLQQEAYTLGINKKVSAMTQAEKAELRYYAIMTQVGVSHKDMARTLEAPANQLRVLKAQVSQAARAIGNIFIPVLQAVLPYCIAFFKVITLVANAIAKLVGFKEFTADLGNMDSLASGAGDFSDALGSAANNAKKLKQYTMGFDELNVIDPKSGSGGSGDSAGVGGGGFDFELPEYEFLSKEGMEKVNAIVDSIKNNLSEVLTIVAGIGAAIAAWAIGKVALLLSTLRAMAGIKFSLPLTFVGLATFLQDLTTFKNYLDDFRENGASFYNVTGMLSTFAGMMGDVLILLGNVKFGGALKVIEGIGQMVGAIQDMTKNGVDTDNALSAINGLTNIAIGIGVFTKNLKFAGAAVAIQGLTTIIGEIATNWEAIKNGDWSGVDKAALAIGAIELFGGLMMALGVFSKVKKAVPPTVTKDIASVGQTVTPVSTEVSTLTSKLTSLMKNLALGIVILLEIAVAVGIFLGAIWGIGVLLEQIGIAWQPVIDNGGQVAIAVGIGTAILVAIGVVVGVLGAFSGVLLTSMALGIAVLALMSAATILFLAEIWLIGTLLAEIGVAWAPVLADGENIAIAIGIGTALLVAIGVVTAALGVATVASAGLLPLAIGLGTALLLELGVATALFLVEILKIGEYLLQVGEGWQPVLDNGATIEAGISKATDLLIAIGVVTAALGLASVASVGLLPLAINLGTDLLVDLADAFIEFCTSLKKVANKLRTDLHPALSKLNKVLPDLSKNMSDFTDFMQEFAEEAVSYTKSTAISGLASTIGDIISFFVDDPIESLAEDVNKTDKHSSTLNKNLESANPKLEKGVGLMKIYKKRLDELRGVVDSINTSAYGEAKFDHLVNIAEKIVDFGEEMDDYYDSVKDIKQDTLTKMVKAIDDIIDFAIRIKNEVDITKINNFTKAIQNLGSAIKGLPTSKKITIDVAYNTSGNPPKGYATGGFPQTGELFIAREAGAEMVGSIGRRTAVANNDQIVEGISYGVARANAESDSLLREQNSLLRAMLEKETGVYLDGKKITSSVEKHQRERGRVVVTGGAY